MLMYSFFTVVFHQVSALVSVIKSCDLPPVPINRRTQGIFSPVRSSPPGLVQIGHSGGVCLQMSLWKGPSLKYRYRMIRRYLLMKNTICMSRYQGVRAVSTRPMHTYAHTRTHTHEVANGTQRIQRTHTYNGPGTQESKWIQPCTTRSVRVTTRSVRVTITHGCAVARSTDARPHENENEHAHAHTPRGHRPACSRGRCCTRLGEIGPRAHHSTLLTGQCMLY